jgi:MFS family permease
MWKVGEAGRLVALVCVAQVLAQIGAFTWATLLPGFLDRWQLDYTEAGWITGVFYGAYTLAVPILVTATDRIDPRKIYLAGVALIVVAHPGFALFAEGFWTALGFRALAGIGWAGTYMTGVKLLADRVDERMLSRAVAGHAAGIGVAGAISFTFAEGMNQWLGWQGAFAVSAGMAATAWLIVALRVPGRGAEAPAPGGGRLFDFRPIFANRSAMAYALAYCVHTWEMGALRGWGVAFLAYVAMATATDPGFLAPAVIVTIMGLLGTGTSVLGNELSIRLGRQKLVGIAFAASIATAAVIGFLGPVSYAIAAALVLLYGAIVWLDSSSLTAGAAASAEPARRGATLAIHSMLGHAGGLMGPLALGFWLDLSGGMSRLGWGIAFAHIAVVMLVGRIIFLFLRPSDLPGDSSS